MLHAKLLVFGLVLAALSSCGKPHEKVLGADGVRVLEGAEKLELMTLDPSHEQFNPNRPGTMHGYKIVGSAPVLSPEARRRLVEALYAAIDGNDGTAASCFNPRHAIRATRGQETVDILICFECLQLQVFTRGIARQATIRRDEEEVFRRIAKELGLPDPPEAVK